MKALKILPLVLILSACGGSGSSEESTSTINVNETVAPTTTNNDDNQQARGTRSPQGINNDNAERRNNARNRNGRDNFQTNQQGTREIRSYDGTSNNVDNPTWGANFEHLQRIGDANYSDGVSSLAGAARNSARTISNLVAAQAEGVSILNTYNTTDFLWQWGQFIDHDFGLTDGSADEPANILVPSGDAFFDPTSTGTVEISFNRAIYDPETGTNTSNPREQENEISSFIDASMIYGSSAERNTALRVGANSTLLKTSPNNLLPLNVDNLTNASGFVADTSTLFLAGDFRANEQLNLTVMHTLWVREHNRIATLLQQQNNGDSVEEIYQSTRRLVIAEIQKITYEEYLPALLGANTMPNYDGYDEDANPGIYSEFSAAAYRLGHSEVSDQLLRINASGTESTDGHVALSEAFFSGINLLKEENDIDPLLRGMATQLHQAIDIKVVNGLRNFLFGQPGSGGFDLTSLNIQRGRDHGLGSYNDTRVAMGLDRVTRFSQITSNQELQDALEEAYSSVDDIDLWVGGLSEDPIVTIGSQLGELFTLIIVKQFDELRIGDRFWYQRYLTDAENDFIADVTLASVIRNNTNIGNELQNNVFFNP